MPYFPIAPGTDNRKAKAMIPISLRNTMLARAPRGAATRSPFLLVPTPGRRLLTTFPANLRGVFSAPGVLNGDLFVAAGSDLYRVSSSYTFASVGTLPGGDRVTMRGRRGNLAIRAAGKLFQFDGATLTQVTDVNAPAVASTLAVVANRLVAANADTDGFGWSRAGLLAFDPDGIANDVDLPDPLVGQEEINGDLCNLNSRSIQFWQATGGTEDLAFAPVVGAWIEHGLMGRDAIADAGDGRKMFLGDDRVAYRTGGMDVSAIPNPDMEDALAAFTETELASDAVAWSYKDGAKVYWTLRTSLERAFCYDLSEGTVFERTRFGADQYDIAFAARAYGGQIVASPDSPDLWALDPDVFDDAGTPIERKMTVHVPVGRDTSVDRVVWDMRCRDQPLTGQGSAPQMMLNWSMDGGETWSLESGLTRTVNLPPAGVTGFRIQEFTFGRVLTEHGWLLEQTITDPFRYALAGVWVNPTDAELT